MARLALVAIAAGIAAVAASERAYAANERYAAWRAKYRRNYATVEEAALRRAVFADNAAVVDGHNMGPNRAFTMALNGFADLTHDEFRARFTGKLTPRVTAAAAGGDLTAGGGSEVRLWTGVGTGALPAEWDWAAQGKVQAVKNQGDCGGCWAFSVTAAIESITAIKTGTLLSLSEQEIIDCDRADGNDGCNGGDQVPAFKWVKAQGGMCTEAEYPFAGKNTPCKTCTTVAITNTTGVAVIGRNDTALMSALYTRPVSVSVDAADAAWQFYSGGVMNSTCGNSLDHAVLGTGWGSNAPTSGLNYYIIKNSWGTDWGNQGYIWLARGYDEKGECGMLLANSMPLKNED